MLLQRFRHEEGWPERDTWVCRKNGSDLLCKCREKTGIVGSGSEGKAVRGFGVFGGIIKMHRS